MESKKINQLATELAPVLSDLTIIGDPTTGISRKITLSQMASLFTGTVEEYPNLASFPLVGTADTIYIALDTNIIYRWNTSTNAYVELSPNIVTSLVFNDANGFDGTISLVGSTATLTITTALTQGSVPFIGTSGALTQDNANLFFDDTNNRLGINTNAPTTALDVFGSGIIGRLNGTSTNNAFLGFASAGTNRWSIGNVQSDNRFRIYNEATTSELISVLSTGEFGIGIANPTTKFHIDGAATALIANLDANVSVAKSISFRSDNSNRINLEVSGTESGSNAGADFFLRTFTDAGALLATPLTIVRSTGNATFSANVTAVGLIGTGLYTNSWFAGSGSTLSLRTAASGVIADFSPTTSYIVGFVGINGSTTPAAALTVYDQTSGSEQLRLCNSTGSGYWGIGRENNVTGNLYFNSGGNLRVVFTSGGLVGIGTSDVTNIGANYTALNINGASGYGAGLILKVNNVLESQLYVESGLTTLNIAGAYTITGSFGTAFRITSGGNVLIGTSTDNAGKLQVNGEIRMYGSTLFRGMSSNTLQLCGGTSSSNVKIDGSVEVVTIDTNGSERMRIASNGNVNVGISSAVLEVGSTGLNGKLGVRFGGAGKVGIDTRDDDDASNCIYIFFRKSDGTGIGSITRNGLTNAVLYNTTSDYRLKEDFKEINGLDKISAIKVYDFKWKGLEDRMDGVIAHELAEIMPYAVHGEKDAIDEEGNIVYQGVDYSKIVPSLIKAIQELKLEIDILKAK